MQKLSHSYFKIRNLNYLEEVQIKDWMPHLIRRGITRILKCHSLAVHWLIILTKKLLESLKESLCKVFLHFKCTGDLHPIQTWISIEGLNQLREITSHKGVRKCIILWLTLRDRIVWDSLPTVVNLEIKINQRRLEALKVSRILKLCRPSLMYVFFNFNFIDWPSVCVSKKIIRRS
jgi:hypothetical protein